MNWISRVIRKTTEAWRCEWSFWICTAATLWHHKFLIQKSRGFTFSVISMKKKRPIISVIKERHPLIHHKSLPTELENFEDGDLLIHSSGNCSSCHRGDSMNTQKTTSAYQSIYAVFLVFCFLINGEEPNTRGTLYATYVQCCEISLNWHTLPA